MPIYQLDDKRPEFPSDGRYWVAETAVLIGRVRLKRKSRITRRCTPILDFRSPSGPTV
jgi:carbonic anhydrase/acetyltransferase-like protein (isoleucine patch superfamily)